MTLNSLVKYYDALIKQNEPICPISHVSISAHIGILIDADGNFLCAQIPSVKGEAVHVPCTIESEGRTSNIAPHIMSDQLCYVANCGEQFTARHEAYLSQLEHFVSCCPDDAYANAIYKYVQKGTLMDDIRDVLPEKTAIPLEKMNAIFCVYGLSNEGADPCWTEWYLSQLEVNGVCCITGESDYIPSSYPKCITSSNGNEVLFQKGSPVGYTASQKIIHALQYMIYGRKNRNRVEAEYKMQALVSWEIGLDELKEWVDRNYPGKWEKFYSILTNDE